MEGVSGLRVEADPRGGAALLSWTTPQAASFRGVRVLRREGRFPVAGRDEAAAVVHEDFDTAAGARASWRDGQLRAEEVYYYAVVAYDAGDEASPAALASVLTTAPYRTAEHLYRNIPEVHRIYDTQGAPAAPGVDPADHAKGPLRRLVELVSGPLELLRSAASATRTFHDAARVDGALLPLLADWIGRPADRTTDLARQRTQLRFAPHYDRTTGIPANLRAAVNRLTNWDARLKELAHNVFRANDPERLAPHETSRAAGVWSPPARVSSHVAHEGRPAAVRGADGRVWLFFQARQAPPTARGSRALRPSEDRLHLFVKVEDDGAWLPALRLTDGADLHRHPFPVMRSDGSVWLFSTRHVRSGGAPGEGGLALHVLAAGRLAAPAQLAGDAAEPFALSDGEALDVSIGSGGGVVVRRVVARPEAFGDPNAATADEVARLLARELPGVDAWASGGRVHLATRARGAAASLGVAASTMGDALGLSAAAATGRDASPARLVGARSGPFDLRGAPTLTVKSRGDAWRTVTFAPSDFDDAGAAQAEEVAAAIERAVPGLAGAEGGRVVLTSAGAAAPRPGLPPAPPAPAPLVAVDPSASSAAPALGFGVPPPAAPAGMAEEMPSAFVDGAGRTWAFWSSRRDGVWHLWYAQLDALGWAEPRQLTSGLAADREPFALLDPRGTPQIWVFWTRAAAGGRANVRFRTTAKLDFAGLTVGDWLEGELAGDVERREPAAVVAPGVGVEVYYVASAGEGWQTWSRTLTAAPPPVNASAQGAEAGATSGQPTNRWPWALAASDGSVRLWTRCNAPRLYESRVYPLARTFDARDAGSTLADTRNGAKLSRLRRGGGPAAATEASATGYDDINRYTSDTGRGGVSPVAPFFSRDTVAVFLTPDTEDQQLVLRQQRLLEDVLRRHLPIQVRIAFQVDLVHREYVYGYAQPADAGPDRAFIGELGYDSIVSEVPGAAADRRLDRIAGRWLRTFAAGGVGTALPDLSSATPDLSSRLYTSAFDEGGS